MKRRSALLICTVVLAVAALALSAGFTAAYWSGTGESNKAAAPGVWTTDWNSWAKYFEYEIVEEGNPHAEISGFSGTNLGDVVFPSSLNGASVTVLRNTIFASTTLKALPVTIALPPTLKTVAPAAFAGLDNLRAVEAGDPSGGLYNDLSFGEFCFAGCRSLTSIDCYGTRGVFFSAGSLQGCSVSIRASASTTVRWRVVTFVTAEDGTVTSNVVTHILSADNTAEFAAFTGALNVTFGAI